MVKDRVVIITGASSGIGEALARKFAAQGSRLVLAARRLEKLENLSRDISPAEVLIVRTDVSKEEECRELIDKAIARFGAIDVLINNAGISMRALFEETDLSVIRRLMDVNFWGTVYCTKYALPYILQKRGTVAGIISVAGHVGLPGRTGYSASKYAVRGFLDALRIENLRKGLHVLVAAPGFTASEVRLSALDGKGDQQGESPRNEKKMMPAHVCAAHIYKAVVRRKRELVLTFFEGKLTVLIGKFFPALLDELTYRHMSKEPGSPFT